MDLVFDVMMCDTLDFTLPRAAASTQKYQSLEEAAKALCAHIGIELLEYDTLRLIPVGDNVIVQLRGRRWVEQQRR